MPEHQLPYPDTEETSLLLQILQAQDEDTLALATELRNIWDETTQEKRNELYSMMDIATKRDPALKEIATNFYLLGVYTERKKNQQ